jgi:hypothetical protein
LDKKELDGTKRDEGRNDSETLKTSEWRNDREYWKGFDSVGTADGANLIGDWLLSDAEELCDDMTSERWENDPSEWNDIVIDWSSDEGEDSPADANWDERENLFVQSWSDEVGKLPISIKSDDA